MEEEMESLMMLSASGLNELKKRWTVKMMLSASGLIIMYRKIRL